MLWKCKSPAISRITGLFLGVPGGTRTHDIQRSAAGRLQGKNHKQSFEYLESPVFIGISADFDFYFAAILRLFTQGPILFQ